MIAFILAKFINTVGPRSVASNAVKVKLNSQHGAQAALELHQRSTGMCDSSDGFKVASSYNWWLTFFYTDGNCCFYNWAEFTYSEILNG